MKYTRTSRFIFPLLFNVDFYTKRGFKNAYLEYLNFEYPYNTQFGDFIFLEIDTNHENFNDIVHSTLTFFNGYYSAEEVEEGVFIYSFKLDNEIKEIVQLFLEGKYSKFPEEYKNLFEKKTIVGKDNFGNNLTILNKDWMVLHKHPELKSILEKRLGVEIPDYLDLESIPNLKQETYYDKNVHQQPTR